MPDLALLFALDQSKVNESIEGLADGGAAISRALAQGLLVDVDLGVNVSLAGKTDECF